MRKLLEAVLLHFVREMSMLIHAPCRLGTAVVFIALYFKTFTKGKQAQQAPKNSPLKDPVRSPGKTPTRSPKLANTGKPQWDMEAAGKRS